MKTSALISVLAVLGVGLAAMDGRAADVKPPEKQPESKQPESKPAAAEPAKEPATASRVDLDATQITGNRELPRVLYVVPWKRADLGEMSGKPAKSLLDEVLAPVDRDVFRRQNRYHDALQTEAAAPAADAAKGER
jgi:hypothetical protein